MRLNNFYTEKTVIVTGASSGIGREIAKEFVRNGANVLVTSRREERLKSLVTECESFSGKCIPLVADLRDLSNIDRIVAMASDISGKIDILVNNAALGFDAPLCDIPDEKIIEIFNVNLLATVFLTRAAIQKMPIKQNSSIVFVTSLAGKIGFPNLSAYTASKFAIEGFAEAVRHELHENDISVTVLRPGVTDTEFFDNAMMKGYADNAKQHGKMHSPSIIAKYLIDNLPQSPRELTYGRDSLFIKILPFIPFHLRFKILSLIS